MFRVLIFFLLFFTRTASAQMAVIDTNGLAESIKQNATMAAILENGKALWDTTKEGLEATKQITDTVGSAVSLALTAQSFITNANQLLQCVTPQFLLDGMNFEVTNICTAQDYIRQALDLPTNEDVQGAANTVSGVAGGSYSWRGITTGNNRTKQQWRKVKKARTDFHKKKRGRRSGERYGGQGGSEHADKGGFFDHSGHEHVFNGYGKAVADEQGFGGHTRRACPTEHFDREHSASHRLERETDRGDDCV